MPWSWLLFLMEQKNSKFYNFWSACSKKKSSFESCVISAATLLLVARSENGCFNFWFSGEYLGISWLNFNFFEVLKVTMAALHFAAGSKVLNWVPRNKIISVGGMQRSKSCARTVVYTMTNGRENSVRPHCNQRQ